MHVPQHQPLDELPELVFDQIAKLLDNEDRLQLMASSRKAAQICMCYDNLRLQVDDRVKWMRLKQVLPWAKGLRHLMIRTNRAFQPLAEQSNQQNLAACDVLLGPAYSTYMHGVSLTGVLTLTIKAKGLPSFVPHFIAAACPNLERMVYQPTVTTSFTDQSLPIPQCNSLNHIECHEWWLPAAHHTPEDLRRQLPNITSLTLRALTRDWLHAWSDQLSTLELCEYKRGSSFGSYLQGVKPAPQLKHVTIMDWDGKLPIHVIAPALTSLALPNSIITQGSMQTLAHVTSLTSLEAASLDARSFKSTFNLRALMPNLKSLELPRHYLSDSSLYVILQLKNLTSLKVQGLGSSISSDFSLLDCNWQRLEFEARHSIDFGLLLKLPLNSIKKLVVNCINESEESMVVSLPHHSKLAALGLLQRNLLGSLKLNMKEPKTSRYGWQMHEGNTDGEEAAAMFSAVAALLKPVPILDLRNFNKESAYLSAMMHWASATVTQVMVEYDALLQPGFIQSLQHLPSLSVISTNLQQTASNTSESNGQHADCLEGQWLEAAVNKVTDMVVTHLVTPAMRPITMKFALHGVEKRLLYSSQ